jgi:hypothetical protein
MTWAASATGNVNSYVNMTTEGMTATFALLQPFTTQIKVTCSSTIDSSISSTATLDYYKRFTAPDESTIEDWVQYSSKEKNSNGVYNIESNVGFSLSSCFGVGSLDDEVLSCTIECEVTNNFANYFMSCLYDMVMISEVIKISYTESNLYVSQSSLMEGLIPSYSEREADYIACWAYASNVYSNELKITVNVNLKYNGQHSFVKTYNLVPKAAAVASVSLDSETIVM